MQIQAGKKIFFLSDFHLGAPDAITTLQREKLIVGFLDQIKHEADTVLLVGHVLDCWYEYNTVVLRGYVRLLAKFSVYTDSGLAISLFLGNHPLWLKIYYEKELNV